jgi:hypothetical protein
MTQDEIIEMVRDTANHGTHASGEIIYTFYLEQLVAFAHLVAAKEREACAKLIDPTEEHRKDASWGYIGGNEGVEMLDDLAALIRARGEQA